MMGISDNLSTICYTIMMGIISGSLSTICYNIMKYWQLPYSKQHSSVNKLTIMIDN